MISVIDTRATVPNHAYAHESVSSEPKFFEVFVF